MKAGPSLALPVGAEALYVSGIVGTEVDERAGRVARRQRRPAPCRGRKRDRGRDVPDPQAAVLVTAQDRRVVVADPALQDLLPLDAAAVFRVEPAVLLGRT